MGHYASESDPGWPNRISRMEIALDHRKLLQHQSLGEFQVRDLPMLLKIMEGKDLRPEELERLRDMGWRVS